MQFKLTKTGLLGLFKIDLEKKKKVKIKGEKKINPEKTLPDCT